MNIRFIESEDRIPEGYELYLDRIKTEDFFSLSGAIAHKIDAPYRNPFRQCKQGLIKILEPEFQKMRSKLLGVENDERYRISDEIVSQQINSIESFKSLLLGFEEVEHKESATTLENGVVPRIPIPIKEEGVLIESTGEVRSKEILPDYDIFENNYEEVPMAKINTPVTDNLFKNMSIPEITYEDEEIEEDEEDVEDGDKPNDNSALIVSGSGGISARELFDKITDHIYSISNDQKKEINEGKNELLSFMKGISSNLEDMQDKLKRMESIEPKEQVKDFIIRPKVLNKQPLLENYQPPEALRNYLKHDVAFKPKATNHSYKGIKVGDGMTGFLEKFDDGFFEFVARYYPFIFKEYEDNVLNREV